MSTAPSRDYCAWPAASRVPLPLRNERVLSTALLLLVGGGAAAFTILAGDLLKPTGMRIPGHAIVRSVLPFLLGLAMVPRPGSGSIMGVGAALTAGVLAFFGQTKGPGGMISLLLLGPALDIALTRARANWLLYVRFAAAGLAVNLLAFAVQMTAKSLGVNLGGGRDLTSWFSIAAISYPLCGLAAGLISGLVWFHWSPRGRPTSADESRK